MLKSHKDLKVWQRAIELVVAVYALTKRLPKEEQYGLVSQMRRAAVSVPSNITEGYKRQGSAEYLRYLNIAEASLAELDTQIIICQKIYPTLEYDEVLLLRTEVEKMLFVMIRKLRNLNS